MALMSPLHPRRQMEILVRDGMSKVSGGLVAAAAGVLIWGLGGICWAAWLLVSSFFAF